MSEAADPDTRAARARLGSVVGGKWALESLIGMGGMASVYAARAPDGSRAAVKVLHASMGESSDLRQRFAQEGAAATHVGHPGVVEVLDSGEDPDGTAYLVLELLEGEPLSSTLKRDDGIAIPRLLEVLDQVLDVLAAAHAKGIVHRDLKPDNLFVVASGRIKVLDFGVARVLDDLPGAFKTRVGVTLGTVPFMSPEQALGKRAQVDGRSDLFSLGAMTFRLVARRNVHEAPTEGDLLVAMASKPAPPLVSVAPDVPPGLAAIVDLALAFSKDSRYPDARTMQLDVRALAEGKPPPYAMRVRKARDMATRTDFVPPVSIQMATSPAEPAAAAARPTATKPAPVAANALPRPPLVEGPTLASAPPPLALNQAIPNGRSVAGRWPQAGASGGRTGSARRAPVGEA